MGEILHVTTRPAWEQAVVAGEYRADSLLTEGFIHCSTEAQLAGVIERYYRGRTDLIVLRIAEDQVEAEVRWELSPSIKERFPHIYGPLNVSAVLGVRPL